MFLCEGLVGLGSVVVELGGNALVEGITQGVDSGGEGSIGEPRARGTELVEGLIAYTSGPGVQAKVVDWGSTRDRGHSSDSTIARAIGTTCPVPVD